MRLVLKNIGSLLVAGHDPAPWVAGEEMASVGIVQDAWLVTEQGKIACYGEGEVIPFADDEVLERRIGQLLVSSNLTLASAESCTGGLISDRINVLF